MKLLNFTAQPNGLRLETFLVDTGRQHAELVEACRAPFDRLRALAADINGNGTRSNQANLSNKSSQRGQNER
jgi:hypothetical protein